ncbi:MAG: hypothetical protein FWC40_07590, partial [Proteobacteria bacterium]|nr:hypothetical protein [Pseudomonadota bacterium]
LSAVQIRRAFYDGTGASIAAQGALPPHKASFSRGDGAGSHGPVLTLNLLILSAQYAITCGCTYCHDQEKFMPLLKSLAYALFMVFLCTAPILANAQDVSYLIDIPNVENDTKTFTFTKAFREMFSEAGNIVFTEEEMLRSARELGYAGTYWTNPQSIKALNKKLRHDAVIRVVFQSTKKSNSLIIYIYNAYTGELLAEFERKLQRKDRLSTADRRALMSGIMPVLAEIDPSVVPIEITIKVVSVPEGAAVMRNGLEIGRTPFAYTTSIQDEGNEEQWVLAYPDREPVVQTIAMDRSGSYEVFLPEPELPEPEGSFTGGHRVLLVGFNVSPTIRQLKSSAKEGDVFSYTTQAYPTFSFDLEFYPLALFVENDYLKGLGFIASVGYGFLDTSLRIHNASSTDNQCRNNDDGTVTCSTSYLRFNINLIYRLLLQKGEDGLDPKGLALDFLVGYQMSRFELKRNPLYTGHIYDGLQLGTRFSTPLGLEQLRLQIGLNFNINLAHGDIFMVSRWGSRVDSSWGMNTSLAMTYDIWKGIFVRAGYAFTYHGNQYKGNGCLNAQCTLPINASSNDFYHEIMFGFGYMLY